LLSSADGVKATEGDTLGDKVRFDRLRSTFGQSLIIAVFVKRHPEPANDGTDTGTQYGDNVRLVVIPTCDGTGSRAD
jgi:hypothetical protein